MPVAAPSLLPPSLAARLSEEQLRLLSETARSQRSWTANVSTIDAEQKGTAVTIQEPGDRKGRPYISCRSNVPGYVGATLAVAR